MQTQLTFFHSLFPAVRRKVLQECKKCLVEIARHIAKKDRARLIIKSSTLPHLETGRGYDYDRNPEIALPASDYSPRKITGPGKERNWLFVSGSRFSSSMDLKNICNN